MNNLFRITKDNVNNFFIEYDKNKYVSNEIINGAKIKTKTKTKTKTKIKTNNKHHQMNIKKSEPKNDIVKENNLIYVQNKVSIPEHMKINKNIKKNFNCEIKKNKDEEMSDREINKNFPSIYLNNQEKKNINDTNCINYNSNKNSHNNNQDVILEYGKSGIKLDRLKKSMKKNLNTLNQIDIFIRTFLDMNPKLKLNELINDKNKDKNEHEIFKNKLGKISIINNEYINLTIDKIMDKSVKKYNLVDFGYIKIHDIKFTDEFINKHRIPSLNSILTFSDNIKHFLKLIKLFDHTNKYKIKVNQFSNNNLTNIIYQNLPSIITNINDKKNLFKSTDKKFTFYIKITNANANAFIINKKEKLIYYINSVETTNSGYIFFYVLNIDDKYKIINLNQIEKKNKKTNDKKLKEIKNNDIIDINKLNNIKNKIEKISDISEISDVSDFTDTDTCKNKYVPISETMER